MQRLTGIGVSPGVVVGRAVLLMQNPLVIRFPIGPKRVASELARLDEALEQSRRQLMEIRGRVARGTAAELGYLFEAQLLMIDDPMLVARARTLIAGQRVNAEWAVQRAFEDLSGVFDGIEDAYLRERRGDVADVVGRLRLNLGLARGRGADLFLEVDAGSVLITDELTPSMAAQVDWRKVLGFASDTGSRTDHTAILARSLHVPGVVGLRTASLQVPPGARVIIDGTSGEVVVEPTSDLVERAERRGRARRKPALPESYAPASAPISTDGVAISLQANIELPGDVLAARESGATGIGLYRSEFLLATIPADDAGEDAQCDAYRTLVEGMAPGEVTVRTFDVDDEQWRPWPRADDPAVSRSRDGAPGGALGLRGIRVGLARRDLLKVQLRALLRASRFGRLRIIFPFVSGVEEFRAAKAAVREAADDLAAKGEALDTLPPIGVMIEIPSAAQTADLLAREADFFSIGTNDLVQYLLAVDRTDARVSYLFEPLHPAVLRTLRSVIRAAARRHLPVSLCGEMAADPAVLPLLVGLGLDDFSMSPAAIPVARGVVERLDTRLARRLATRVMRMPTAADVERCLLKDLEPGAARGELAGREPGKGGRSGTR